MQVLQVPRVRSAFRVWSLVAACLVAACVLVPSVPVRAGLVHHWRLDEESGLAAAESVGGADGTLRNFDLDDDSQWVEGSFEGALDLGADSTFNNYFEANVPAMDASLTGGFTIALWINPGDAILNPNEYQIVNTPGDAVGFTIMNTVRDGVVHDRVLLFWDGNLQALHVGTTPLEPGTWYHVAITSTGAGGVKRYFVDGVEDPGRLFSPAQGGVEGNHPGTVNGWGVGTLRIGAINLGQRGHDSLVDDVRIYDDALSAEDLLDIIENPPTPLSRITLLAPEPGNAFHDPADGIEFEVAAAPGTTVPTAGIRLVLNGTDVSGGLVIGGSATLREAQYAGLVANTAYAALIEVTDGNGSVARMSFAFATLPPNEDPTLLHHYRLDETTGLLALDSASGRNATLFNFDAGDDSQWVPGKVGGALDFGSDATWNNYVQMEVDAFDATVTGGFTVAMWINPGQQILTPGEYQLLATPGDTVGFTIMNGTRDGLVHDRVLLFWDGSLRDLHVGTTTLEPGNWYHVAITSEGPGGVKRYYLNGSLEEARLFSPLQGGTEGFHPATQAGWAAGTAEIGGIGGAGRTHDTIFDDVRIYNVALDEGSIEDLVGEAPPEPLEVTSTVPADGNLFHDATLGFEFDVATPNAGATIADADIKLSLNGTDVSAQLVFGGSPTSREVAYAGLVADTHYTAVIEAVDTRGGGASRTVRFGTFTRTEAGLRHHYRMDESSGLVASDDVLGSDATLLNFEDDDDSQWVSGPVGGALDLGADPTVDNYAEMTVPAMNAAVTGGFTVALWVNPGEAILTPGEHQLLGTPGDAVGFSMMNTVRDEILHDRVLLFWDGSLPDLHVGTTTLEPGVWYHVAITSTGIGGEKRYFVDGVEEEQRLFAPLSGGVEGNHPGSRDGWGAGVATIGAFGDGTRTHGSVVDDVRIYDEALSPERIAALAEGGPPVQTFVRGDADANGAMNITDGIYLLNFLFLGGPEPPCEDAADADDSGQLNITDGIYVLNFLFLGGPDPTAPHPACGRDPGDDDGLGCLDFPPCS